MSPSKRNSVPVSTHSPLFPPWRPWQWWIYVLCRFADSLASWTVVHQAPLSMEFSRQEYWNTTGVGHHFLLQGIFPTQGLNLCLSCVTCLAGRFFTTAPPRKPHWFAYSWHFIKYNCKYMALCFCLIYRILEVYPCCSIYQNLLLFTV